MFDLFAFGVLPPAELGTISPSELTYAALATKKCLNCRGFPPDLPVAELIPRQAQCEAPPLDSEPRAAGLRFPSRRQDGSIG